jgi:hypothetical protein
MKRVTKLHVRRAIAAFGKCLSLGHQCTGEVQIREIVLAVIAGRARQLTQANVSRSAENWFSRTLREGDSERQPLTHV